MWARIIISKQIVTQKEIKFVLEYLHGKSLLNFSQVKLL